MSVYEFDRTFEVKITREFKFKPTREQDGITIKAGPLHLTRQLVEPVLAMMIEFYGFPCTMPMGLFQSG